MKSTVAALSLVVVLAAWASWMFRYGVTIDAVEGHFTVLDRWYQEQTICDLENGPYAVDMFDGGCTVIGKREMGLW